MQANLPGGNGHLKDSLKINQILYLGAHNAPMSTFYGWVYAQQNVSLTEQFVKYGARHFKTPLRCCFLDGKPERNQSCWISVFQRGLKNPEKAIDRLKELFDLAQKYPNEIMIVKFETYLLCNTETNGTKGWSSQQVTTMLHNLLVALKADQRAITFEQMILQLQVGVGKTKRIFQHKFNHLDSTVVNQLNTHMILIMYAFKQIGKLIPQKMKSLLINKFISISLKFTQTLNIHQNLITHIVQHIIPMSMSKSVFYNIIAITKKCLILWQLIVLIKEIFQKLQMKSIIIQIKIMALNLNYYDKLEDINLKKTIFY
ncbi:unnamed protein product [Paramecium sonneborni]|uniref:Uncharacterized protein n=1 Tax=Paramecium sonneborni TaxID=65129 RepID=A0A8S1R178_9CILI|nr:unnamed protein product [Paramecium sonneborni]